MPAGSPKPIEQVVPPEENADGGQDNVTAGPSSVAIDANRQTAGMERVLGPANPQPNDWDEV
jgi:hypothetical protein